MPSPCRLKGIIIIACPSTKTRAAYRLIVLLTSLSMAVFGSGGHAQNYIGFRNGDPLGNAFQMGIKSFVLSTLDMRVGVIVGSTTASDGSEDITFGVSVDMLAEVLVRRPWIIYVGAGGAVNYLGDGTVLEAHALAGIEVSLEVFNLDPLSVFLELNGGIPTGIGELNNTTIEENLYGALGINFYF